MTAEEKKLSKRRKLTRPRKKGVVPADEVEKLRKRKAHKPERLVRHCDGIED